jgi:hypothetical protein
MLKHDNMSTTGQKVGRKTQQKDRSIPSPKIM